MEKLLQNPNLIYIKPYRSNKKFCEVFHNINWNLLLIESTDFLLHWMQSHQWCVRMILVWTNMATSSAQHAQSPSVSPAQSNSYTFWFCACGWQKLKLPIWTPVDKIISLVIPLPSPPFPSDFFSPFLTFTSFSPFTSIRHFHNLFFRSAFVLQISITIIIFILMAILIFLSSAVTSLLPLLSPLLSLCEWVCGRFKGDLVAFYSVILRFLIKEHLKSPQCVFSPIPYAPVSLFCLWRCL